jgi:hypothetical protein
MEQKIPTRREALELLDQYIESESLRKHAYAVEGVMRHLARRRGEDERRNGGSSVSFMTSIMNGFLINTARRRVKSFESAGGRRNISEELSLTDGGDVSTSCRKRIWKKLSMRSMNLPGSLSPQP